MSNDPFHAHLDECAQCANNPFELCPVGRVLVESAARDLPTGRKPSEPVLANMPIPMSPEAAEWTRKLREVVERPPESGFFMADFSSYERRFCTAPPPEAPCVLCDAGVPIREVSMSRPDREKDEILVTYGPLQPPKKARKP